MGNHQPGTDLLCQPGRLAAVGVAGDPAFGFAAIDREQGDVEVKRSQRLDEAVVEHGVAAVVDAEAADIYDEAEKPAAALLVAARQFHGRRLRR